MDDNLSVHDITVQDQIRLASGKSGAVKHVVFYVGAHGPFMHDFSAPLNTTADIQAYIQQTVADLRGIVQRQY
ncbi:MAG: hypothetical protein LAN64_16640 [Acidobacteriia bacterium]|nr:hypothetical protein [Terriglobia bacterium]